MKELSSLRWAKEHGVALRDFLGYRHIDADWLEQHFPEGIKLAHAADTYRILSQHQ